MQVQSVWFMVKSLQLREKVITAHGSYQTLATVTSNVFFKQIYKISFLLKEAGCYGDMESLQLITVCSKNVSFTENFD